MSNVVQFLEELARATKPLSAEEFAAAVASAGVDAAAYRALLDRNADALNQALGGRPAMMCMIVPAENDEPQPEEEPGRENEDTPQRETSRAA